MAKWKKYFNTYHSAGTKSKQAKTPAVPSSQYKFASWLPEVYEGTHYRLERYVQYEQMDHDSEVNAALDIIAEFCTQQVDGLPFEIKWYEEPGEGDSMAVKNALQSWINLNDMDKKLWKLFRNTLKFGDQFFIRDPDTWQLYWVNHVDVAQVAMDPNRKKILGYYIKDLSPNQQHLVATGTGNKNHYNGAYQSGSSFGTVVGGAVPNPGNTADNSTAERIPAEHIMHVSLTDGTDAIYPFGPSILEPVFKVYKQKELLEDSILIYRIQRAPEKRAFYVDTGDMPTHRAMAYMEQVKNEIHQKRIPNKFGGTSNITDSTYNPQSIIEDFWFNVNSEGKGSRVEVLSGGQNLGEIDDLRYFALKLLRGLRIPGSYLPSGTDESSNVPISDGRINSAFVQEFRFTEYCKRLQNLIAPTLDEEFKSYMKYRGFNVDGSLYRIMFNEPMNFSKYRQIELEGSMLSAFGNMMNNKFISKRYAMKRFLGWTDEELFENERMLMEEMADKIQGVNLDGPGGEFDDAGPSLASVGIGTGPDSDMDMEPDLGDMPAGGGEGGAPDLGGDSGSPDELGA